MMLSKDLIWLIRWFKDQCNDGWHKENHISMNSITNPGWSLKINIRGTSMAFRIFEKSRLDRSEHDWFSCFVEDQIFKGFGGPTNLPEILAIFRSWACDTTYKKESLPNMSDWSSDDDFIWLLNWFHSQCNSFWESCEGIKITSTSVPGWNVVIGIGNTYVSERPFDPVSIRRSASDWVVCSIENEKFQAVGGVENLPEILHIFRCWAREFCEYNELPPASQWYSRYPEKFNPPS